MSVNTSSDSSGVPTTSFGPVGTTLSIQNVNAINAAQNVRSVPEAALVSLAGSVPTPAGQIDGAETSNGANDINATPQNAMVAYPAQSGALSHPTNFSSSHHPGPASSSQDATFIQNNFRQSNNLEFLQQQIHITQTSTDPRVVADAWRAINAAQQETQAVRAEAQSIVQSLDSEVNNLKTTNAALLNEGHQKLQEAEREVNNAKAQRDATARDASQAVSNATSKVQHLRERLKLMEGSIFDCWSIIHYSTRTEFEDRNVGTSIGAS